MAVRLTPSPLAGLLSRGGRVPRSCGPPWTLTWRVMVLPAVAGRGGRGVSPAGVAPRALMSRSACVNEDLFRRTSLDRNGAEATRLRDGRSMGVEAAAVCQKSYPPPALVQATQMFHTVTIPLGVCLLRHDLTMVITLGFTPSSNC